MGIRAFREGTGESDYQDAGGAGAFEHAGTFGEGGAGGVDIVEQAEAAAAHVAVDGEGAADVGAALVAGELHLRFGVLQAGEQGGFEGDIPVLAGLLRE